MLVSLATTGAVSWAMVAGTAVADAATRSRSGAIHGRLLDSATRIATNSGAASSGLHLTGLDVMAGFVGLMAVLAFGFLVVTLIRRRTPLAR
jgi:hypothetical protein